MKSELAAPDSRAHPYETAPPNKGRGFIRMGAEKFETDEKCRIFEILKLRAGHRWEGFAQSLMASEIGGINAGEDHALVHLKLDGRVAVFPESGLGGGDADAEALDEVQNAHGFGEMRVAIICQPGLAEVGGGDIAEGSAGADDLDSVVKPVGADGGWDVLEIEMV